MARRPSHKQLITSRPKAVQKTKRTSQSVKDAADAAESRSKSSKAVNAPTVAPNLKALITAKKDIPADKLDMLRGKAKRMRELQHDIDDLNVQVEAKEDELTTIATKEFPTLMEANGVRSIDLDAEGNLPAVVAKLQPFYSANLPKKNPDPGLNWLRQNNHGDLIKTIFTIALPVGNSKVAEKLRTFLKKEGIEYSAKESVHSATLTSFVKERFEEGEPPSPNVLGLLGAFVGKTVKLKTRKEDK